MKRIAIILIATAYSNIKAMETAAVLMEAVKPNVEAKQRIVTPQLLGPAYLDSYGDKIQARVLSQFDMPGGNASCGYQALHNAQVLTKLIFSNEDDKLEEVRLQNLLTKETEKISFFGSDNATWRKQIAKQRTRSRAAKLIELFLMRKFRGDKDIISTNADASAYIYARDFASKHKIGFTTLDPSWNHVELSDILSAITNSTHALTQFCKNANDIHYVYHITAKNIHDELIKRVRAIQRYKNKEDEEIELLVNKYLELTDINFNIEQSATDWLESIEISTLSESEVTPTLPTLHFIVMGDIAWNKSLKSEDLNLQDYDVDYSGREESSMSNFRKFMNTYHQEDANCLGIFVMYDGEPSQVRKTYNWLTSFIATDAQESSNNASNYGHWHSIIVNKVNNKAQFILADSAGNRSRLQDKRLNELIELLDKKPQAESRLSSTNNIFTFRNLAAGLLIAVLAAVIAKNKLSKKSSSLKDSAHLKEGDASDTQEI